MSSFCRVYTPCLRPVVNISTTKLDIKKLYFLPTEFINVFCVALRKMKCLFLYTASTYWFCNRGRVCLLRGTDGIFRICVRFIMIFKVLKIFPSAHPFVLTKQLQNSQRIFLLKFGIGTFSRDLLEFSDCC